MIEKTYLEGELKKHEESVDEAAPFTGHSDLALPILNYEK